MNSLDGNLERTGIGSFSVSRQSYGRHTDPTVGQFMDHMAADIASASSYKD
jgi:hypothetical protein